MRTANGEGSALVSGLARLTCFFLALRESVAVLVGVVVLAAGVSLGCARWTTGD